MLHPRVGTRPKTRYSLRDAALPTFPFFIAAVAGHRLQSSLISTLRNFTTPLPYWSAMGPLLYFLLFSSTVLTPFNTRVRPGPSAVTSQVFHLPPMGFDLTPSTPRVLHTGA